MASLLDLAKNLEKRLSKLDEKANEAAIDTAIVILTDLVNTTPVDTSKALSNWQVAINTPADDKTSAFYQGFQGSTQRVSASAAIAQAKATLRSKKPGDRIYLTNALPYIKRLNDGYSAQAPAGFVERAVLIGRRQVSKIKINL